MRKFLPIALLAVVSAQGQAQGQAKVAPTPDEVLKASPKSDWQALNPADALVMTLPKGQVVILLAPDFAPNSVANIRRLAHTG